MFSRGDYARCITSKYSTLHYGDIVRVLDRDTNYNGEEKICIELVKKVASSGSWRAPLSSSTEYLAKNFELTEYDEVGKVHSIEDKRSPSRFVVLKGGNVIGRYSTSLEAEAVIKKVLAQEPTSELHVYTYTHTAKNPPVQVQYSNELEMAEEVEAEIVDA